MTPAQEETKSDESRQAGASADRPLENPAEDRLGYAPFAKALARGIALMSAPDGLVIAVYGAWGLGKTTVLNFVEHYLESEDADRYVVVRFNPWWFSGRVDIAAAFFDQMRAIFEKWQVRGEHARTLAARLARIVGAASMSGAGDAAAALLEGKPADVPELKKKLAAALGGQEKRLLIIIDDIDRLTADETAELFGVVKGLADFPNTIYVIAFDRDQVARALSQRTGQAGFEYLEKIVQVPFELPLPEHDALLSLFYDQMREIVGQVESDLLDNEELRDLLTNGLDELMKTPRHIVRLTNSLRVTYGAVRGEVNVTDFVALEALRVFEPAVYESIRFRPDMFGIVSGLAHAFPRASEDERRAYHAKWRGAIADPAKRQALDKIVGRLFPETAKILDARIGITRNRIDARRARAISQTEYFPIYFRFALGDQAVSRELVSELVAAAANPDDFAERLLALAAEKTSRGTTRASAMLDELNAQAEAGFAADVIPGLIRVLTSVGDKLWLDADDQFMGVDNPTRIVWLIGGLLARVAEVDRCELLETAVREARSVGTPTLLVRRLVRGLGVPPESSVAATPDEQLDTRETLVSVECARELESVAAERIAAAAAAGQIWNVERPLYLMAEWRQWGDATVVADWFAAVIADDEHLSKCLSSIGSKRVSTRGIRYRLDPRWFDDYAERDDMAAAVRRLRATVDEGGVADACDQYLTELKMLGQGKDPERLDWDS